MKIIKSLHFYVRENEKLIFIYVIIIFKNEGKEEAFLTPMVKVSNFKAIYVRLYKRESKKRKERRKDLIV